MSDSVDPLAQDKKKKKKPTEGADLFKIIKLIMDRNLDPTIVFSFSKREVEGFASSMGKFDLTSDEEKESIEEIFNNAIACLAEEDKNLPQI